MDTVQQSNVQPVISQSQGTSEDTKTLVTVLVLLFAYPAGVVLMWVWTKWSKTVKLLITIPLGCLLLVLIGMFAVAVLAVLNPSEKIDQARCMQICESTATATEKPLCPQICSEKRTEEIDQSTCMQICETASSPEEKELCPKICSEKTVEEIEK